MAKKSSPSLIADNRKARHDFHIHETYEAGIALTGTEIKSIRQGKLNLKDSFCRIDKGEILLYGVHFSHGYVKVTVGLVTGKKLYDKRQDMAERDAKRDIAKRIKEQQKY